jgi:hypothetical protein
MGRELLLLLLLLLLIIIIIIFTKNSSDSVNDNKNKATFEYGSSVLNIQNRYKLKFISVDHMSCFSPKITTNPRAEITKKMYRF